MREKKREHFCCAGQRAHERRRPSCSWTLLSACTCKNDGRRVLARQRFFGASPYMQNLFMQCSVAHAVILSGWQQQLPGHVP
eukprot:1142944-Pelagomonas_calceolata.AAC.3